MLFRSDVSNILGSLVAANVKGIKKPVLRLQMQNGDKVRIKYMTMGRNAGGAWITVNDELRGKIDSDGRFTSYNQQDQEWNGMFTSYITEVNVDVNAALTVYGKMTSQCGCCGLPLTNKESIERGIGPICLDKYGLLSMA